MVTVHYGLWAKSMQLSPLKADEMRLLTFRVNPLKDMRLFSTIGQNNIWKDLLLLINIQDTKSPVICFH